MPDGFEYKDLDQAIIDSRESFSREIPWLKVRHESNVIVLGDDISKVREVLDHLDDLQYTRQWRGGYKS